MIRTSGQLLTMNRAQVMAILNVNEDSFYEGSRFNRADTAIQRVAEMLHQGAGFIDLGAYSTRPGAAQVDEEEEWKRLFPILKAVKSAFPEAVLSIDTFRAGIARKAIEEGAAIINDISAGELDAGMFNIIKHYKIPYCMMHMRGNPQTMQTLCIYDNLVQDIIDYFIPKLNELRLAGVADIWIDPGFGFAKTSEQNFELLAKMQAFKIFDAPVLAGLSRKSMIYKTLNISSEEALNGTIALNMAALINGANVLRVHDVSEAVQTVKLYEKLKPYL